MKKKSFREGILSIADCGKIHVMHLIGSTGLYGAERWVLALMRALDPNKVHSTLVNLVDDRGERSAVVLAAQQRKLNACDFFTGGKFNPAFAISLSQWARSQKVDVIHSHGFKSDVAGLLTARMAGCRVVATPHGWSLEKNNKLRFYEMLDRAILRFMDMVCPLSADLAAGLKNWTKAKKIKLIMNGVDLDEVKATLPARKEHPGTFLIGYVGQLIERKDLPTLLRALRNLSDRGTKVRLVVIGDGPNRHMLQEEACTLGIEDRVQFMGFRSDAAAFLKTFDAFVLPSLMEGIPRCIMEAMVAGVPVVATDIPGNRDLITHGHTGLLFSPGDSADLADKIGHLIRHPEMAEKMALSAVERVEEEFSSRKMGKEYTALYEILRK